MLETRKYSRKPFVIDAVQITDLNIYDVANWCNGEVLEDPKQGKYVKVRVNRPLNDRQTRAFVGDWVLYAGTGYKCYTPKAFSESFEMVSTESTLHETDSRRKPLEVQQ